MQLVWDNFIRCKVVMRFLLQVFSLSLKHHSSQGCLANGIILSIKIYSVKMSPKNIELWNFKLINPSIALVVSHSPSPSKSILAGPF